MFHLYHLKTNNQTVGLAVSRGGKVARFFKQDYCEYDYYEEIGQVKWEWMLWGLFLNDYPEIMEIERYLSKGMNLQIFLMKDGTQE